MSLSIKLDIEDVSKKGNVSCHMLPCGIKLNGFCKVSKYFNPYIRKDGNTLINSLRGYPLQGQNIEVPNGYSGFILRENKQWCSDDRELKATGTFGEFTAWNWDKLPSADDKLVKALQWINIASAVHEPVTESASEAMKILDVSSLNREEIQRAYDYLYKINDRSNGGTLYLQSKVYVAKRRLDSELKQKEATLKWKEKTSEKYKA